MLASYLFRASLTTARAFSQPRMGLLDTIELPFSAWPDDLDWNGHVNNGRVLTLMDQGRLDHMIRTGLLGVMLKARGRPIVAKAEISFRREIFAFKRSTLTTRLESWDERRAYFVHQILRRGEVCAEARLAIAVRAGGKTISVEEVLRRAGAEVTPEFLAAKLTPS